VRATQEPVRNGNGLPLIAGDKLIEIAAVAAEHAADEFAIGGLVGR
jgi:hypothetical protein